MPIYPYRCPTCNFYHEVIKPMSIYDQVEGCPKCNTVMNRQITSPETKPFKPFFNEWLTSEKHPEGVQINSWEDQRRYMKEARVEYAGTKVGKPGCWV